MAWNESGGNGKNPWERAGNRQAAPDLDKIVRDWQRKLAGLFGGRGGGTGSGSPQPAGGSFALIAIILVAWAFTGFYQVDAAERGVVLRFGRYVESTMPGWQWHLPWPIESVERVNISEVVKDQRKTRMLTADENIVDVDLEVQYRKTDPVKYLFSVRETERTIADISESAIREIIGKSKMDYALGEGRADIGLRTEQLIQQTLDDYNTGIEVTKVNLQDVNFPQEVDAAVQDAIKAREDRERLAFEAQAYANDVLPKARGEAARRQAEAEAYKARVVADAEGEAARFVALLAEYERAPQVTRERLYLETVEDVLSRTNKIIVDGASGNSNMMVLPLDKLLEYRQPVGGAGSGRSNATEQMPSIDVTTSRPREELRSRGERQ